MKRRREPWMRPNTALLHMFLIFMTLGMWAPIAALHVIINATVYAVRRWS